MNKNNNFINLLKETNMFVYGLFKGTMIMTPRSTKIWELIKLYLDNDFQKNDVENVQMPALIPLKYMKKEEENFKGFEPELITITEIGKKKLENNEKLILRPTSEVLFSYYFKNILKSYRDLPILLNQWSNVWRWENNTNPFLRTTEFFWNEGHTLHSTKEKAFYFCNKIFEIYKEFINKKLLIPTLEGEKSFSEKFAGAKNSWAIETILPDGQFLQLSTVHYLGHGFVKMFDINFLDKDNKFSLPHQTSWGISTRLIAGLLLTHKDEEGLILPTEIADKQIIIIPIINKKFDNLNILKYCDEIKDILKNKGYRIQIIYKENKSFSYLKKEYTKFGIPILIEIGINEFKNKTITFKLRTEKENKNVLFNHFLENIKIMFQNIDKTLYKKANEKLNKKFQWIQSYDEYKKIIKKDMIYQTYFCGKEVCEKIIKKETNTTSRLLNEIKENKKCFRCNENTKFKAIFGRSY